MGLTAAVAGYALFGLVPNAEAKPAEGTLIVNVNTGTLDELVSIPGIADKLARRIVTGRPYKRVEDLLRVKGIGEFTLGSIRPYVKVEGPTEKRKP